MDVNRDVAMNECPVCGAAKSRMERHLVDVHGFSQDRIAEFKAQKKSRKIIASGKPIHSSRIASEEAGVISRFVARTRTTEHTKVTHLRCHCTFRSASVPEKTKKSVAHCTAFMNVTEKVDDVTVEHCFNHLGHEARRSQLRLEKSAEQYIVSLLRDGLTVRQVYKKVRMEVRGGPRTRLYFVTTRDIRNIASKCRIEPGRLHNLDTVSIQMRVDASSQSDGIQFYSPA